MIFINYLVNQIVKDKSLVNSSELEEILNGIPFLGEIFLCESFSAIHY